MARGRLVGGCVSQGTAPDQLVHDHRYAGRRNQGPACEEFNRYRYGPAHAPEYVLDSSLEAWQTRETAYANADVIYLLAEDDTDPAQRDLDTSCAGAAQGPEPLDRGNGYFRYLNDRHPQQLHQQLWFVPGVAHVGSRMVESPCGVAAAFDAGKCATVEAN